MRINYKYRVASARADLTSAELAAAVCGYVLLVTRVGRLDTLLNKTVALSLRVTCYAMQLVFILV